MYFLMNCMFFFFIGHRKETPVPAKRARNKRERERERSSTLADLHTSFGTPKASNQKSRLFLEGKKRGQETTDHST